jgi:hypothetical protein
VRVKEDSNVFIPKEYGLYYKGRSGVDNLINIYCDESCHLELSAKSPNEQKSMVLGGLSCPKELVREVGAQIRAIKDKHNIKPFNEVKWTKVSNNKIDFYIELIEYFFSNRNLKFRTIVFPDKSKLHYEKYDHDELYYIMYYYLLREMISPRETNCIYIDKKDTRGSRKILRLQEFLRRDKLDYKAEIIQRIQIIDSRDSELMQLADLLIGCVSYANRHLNQLNPEGAKARLVELVKEKSTYTLTRTTLRQESKFNIFIWSAGDVL